MSRSVLVRSAGTEFFAEVEDGGGPQTVGLEEAVSFDGVRDTVEAIGSHLVEAWKKVKPSEASVEFGLSLTVKSGKLTGLLVDGAGSATLKVTMKWAEPHHG